jgi:hypothetical protein
VNLYLIIVVMTVEKRFFTKDQTSEHAAKTPQVQRVVVQLIIKQQFRSLEVPRRHSNVIFLTGVIELRQAPVYQPQLHNNTDPLIILYMYGYTIAIKSLIFNIN